MTDIEKKEGKTDITRTVQSDQHQNKNTCSGNTYRYNGDYVIKSTTERGYVDLKREHKTNI